MHSFVRLGGGGDLRTYRERGHGGRRQRNA